MLVNNVCWRTTCMLLTNFHQHAAPSLDVDEKDVGAWLHVWFFHNIPKGFNQHTFKLLSSSTHSFTSIQGIHHQHTSSTYFTNITTPKVTLTNKSNQTSFKLCSLFIRYTCKLVTNLIHRLDSSGGHPFGVRMWDARNYKGLLSQTCKNRK